MAKSNKQPKSRKVVQNHSFKGCREAFLMMGPAAQPGLNTYTTVTDSTGSANQAWILAPLGLSSVIYGTTITNGAAGNICGPPLRGLFNKAIDFQWYRVTRAKLIFVGALGSTSTGIITLAAYTDPSDVEFITTPANLSSRSTRTFDIAVAANKELSVNVPVDPSWKRVSSIMTTVGNNYPFSAATATTVANVNTAGDLSFGAISIKATSVAPASVSAGTFYLDYDIEFKNPIDSGVNL